MKKYLILILIFVVLSGCVEEEVENDLSDCDKIGDMYEKEYCYGDIAIARKNLSICDDITTEVIKNGCYGGVAKAKGDPSICDKIPNKFYKELCYSETK